MDLLDRRRFFIGWYSVFPKPYDLPFLGGIRPSLSDEITREVGTSFRRNFGTVCRVVRLVSNSALASSTKVIAKLLILGVVKKYPLSTQS
jgi:hypothetical protein